jgi:hypothetical protein
VSNSHIDKTLIDTGIAGRQAEIREEHERIGAGDRGSESQTLRLERAHELKSRVAFEQAGTATLEAPPPSSMEISAETKARGEHMRSRGPGAEVGKVYSLQELASLESSGIRDHRAGRELRSSRSDRTKDFIQGGRDIRAKEKALVQELHERSKRELTPNKEELLARIDKLQQKVLRSRGLAHVAERPQVKTLGFNVDVSSSTVSARARNMMQGPKKSRDRDR